MKEFIKVCVIDVSDGNYDTNPREWTDEEFLNTAKADGRVYTLQYFEDAFNFAPHSAVSTEDNIIRFISHDAENSIQKEKQEGEEAEAK